MRQPLAVLIGAFVASLGAIVLGEYHLTGGVALVAGLLFGLAVAEVVVAVGRRLGRVTMAVTAAVSGLGFVWAVWIDSDHLRNPVPVSSWAGAAVACGSAELWLALAHRNAPRSGAPGTAPSEALTGQQPTPLAGEDQHEA
jgi:hypothetical protein